MLIDRLYQLFIKTKQRKISVVPKKIIVLFILGLVLQLSLQLSFQLDINAQFSNGNIVAEELTSPPASSQFLTALSLGEPEVLAKVLMLWLQAFDNQPGVSVPFAQLNYDNIEKWLRQIIHLDPRANYPLLVASRIYTEVPDHNKQRQMMALVYQEFKKNPKKNWLWLAHVTVLAKHRLKDNVLALKFAHSLADINYVKEIPAWARQLEIIILEDIDELAAIQILTGGLIQSQSIKDPKELLWIEQRLKALKAKQLNKTDLEKVER